MKKAAKVSAQNWLKIKIGWQTVPQIGTSYIWYDIWQITVSNIWSPVAVNWENVRRATDSWDL